MKTRIISGLCMLPFAVIVYLGGIPLMIAGAFLSAACVFELFRGFESMDIHPSKVLRSEERRVGKECRSRWSPYH